MRLARILVPINFTREPRFRHDPAYSCPPLPTLQTAAELAEHGEETLGFAKTQLMRGQNRYLAAIDEARCAGRGSAAMTKILYQFATAKQRTDLGQAEVERRLAYLRNKVSPGPRSRSRRRRSGPAASRASTRRRLPCPRSCARSIGRRRAASMR